MARNANVQWNLPEGVRSKDSVVHTHADIQIAVLMDIRDELQKLNSLLHCHNFTGIPTTLKSIRRAMPIRRKAKK